MCAPPHGLEEGGECPGAAVTSDHKLGCLQQQTFVLCHFWRLQVQDHSVSRLLPSEARRGIRSKPLPAPGASGPRACGCNTPPQPPYSGGMGPTLAQHDLISTSHSHSNPVSIGGPFPGSGWTGVLGATAHPRSGAQKEGGQMLLLGSLVCPAVQHVCGHKVSATQGTLAVALLGRQWDCPATRS